MRGRKTKPIVAEPADVRSIHRCIRAAKTESRMLSMMLLVVVVATALAGLSLRRADMAEMRMKIYEEQAR